MKTILTLLFLNSLVLSFGQDTLTVFYDIYGEKVEKEDTNGYFLQLWKLDENTWGSICHYKTGRKVEVQYYSSEAKKRKGDFVSYYENGNVDELGKYKDSLRTGTWLSYYKSGQLSDSTVYKFDNKNGTYHHFYKSGQLKDYGTYSDGKKNSDWLFYFENGKLSGKIKYQNDEAISVEYWDESGVAQVDNLVPEITPEFPGGNYAMMQFIMANFQYPEFAREMGEQGTTYIEFLVTESGELTNIKVVKGTSPSIDAEAVRVIEAMPNWNPGVQFNRPVSVRFTIPIRCRLAGGKKTKEKKKRFSRK